MDTDVTVDIGKNAVSLIEKLANTIGLAKDQIFPYYVHQMYIQGWVTLITMVVMVIVSSIVVRYTFKKANWPQGNLYAIVSTMCIIGILVGRDSYSLGT